MFEYGRYNLVNQYGTLKLSFRFRIAEGGYEARALGYSIFTQADTMGELRRNVREAVQTHCDQGQSPAVIRLHVVKDEVLPV